MIVKDEHIDACTIKNAIIHIEKYGKIKDSNLYSCTVHVAGDGALVGCLLHNCNLHLPEDQEERDKALVLNNTFKAFPGNNIYDDGFPAFALLVQGNYIDGEKNES